MNLVPIFQALELLRKPHQWICYLCYDTQPHGSVRTGHFPGIFRLREDYFRVSNSKSLHNHLTVTRQQQIITAHDPGFEN